MTHRLLISGSNGFVGSELIPIALNFGSEVFSIRRHKQGYLLKDHNKKNENADFIISTLEEISLVINSQTCVINLAACVSKLDEIENLKELISANLEFSSVLAKIACEENAKKFIQISTYSDSTDGETYSPQTFYAATKKANEDLLTYFHQNYLTDIIFLHFYDIYGSNQPHKRFLPLLIRAILSGENFQMSQGEQEVNFLHVKDACEAIVSAASMDSVKTSIPAHYAVYGPETFTLKKLPKLAATILGKELNDKKILMNLPYRKNEIMHFHPAHAPLPDWSARIRLNEGLKAMQLESKE
jgi:nucleoside-diphosphate-sugar epimerase